MRLLFLSAFLWLLPRVAAAQLATTFQDAEARGVRIQYLDSIYRSAVHADTAKAMFAGRETEVSAAYVKLLQELGAFLKAHDFAWGQPTKGFNRLYFRADGTIDYYLYNFRPGAITPEQEVIFRRLLGEFILTHKIDLRGRGPFAQCSGVTYTDAPAAKK